MRNAFGALCGVAALVLLLIPTGNNPGPTPPVVTDEVHAAFETYERLWRELAGKAAAKIDSGEFTTDTQVYEYLATGQEPCRKVAFDTIAKKEQEVLGDGKWTPELHSSVLKGYSK